jgi:polar amino acid transport system ATP-binding protein
MRSRLIDRAPWRAGPPAATTDEAVPAIDIVGLAKTFDGNHVLRGVDLTVRAGESLTSIGGRGTGTSVRCA